MKAITVFTKSIDPKISSIRTQEIEKNNLSQLIPTIVTERNRKNKEGKCWYFNNSKCRYGDRCRKTHSIEQTKAPKKVYQKPSKPNYYRVGNQYNRYNEQSRPNHYRVEIQKKSMRKMYTGQKKRKIQYR